jgi:branched-chain amino acid transport system ATP-binding protein
VGGRGSLRFDIGYRYLVLKETANPPFPYSLVKQMPPILIVQELTKKFGGLTAVDHVSISIEKEAITLLMGPNGSGKTTLINCVSGLYRPDSGRIRYDDIDVTRKTLHEIAKVGMLRTFQIPAPYKSLSLLENLLVAYQNNPGERTRFALLKNKWAKIEDDTTKKAIEILKLLELDRLIDELASNLSGGQLKLLELGRVLMADARTVLLDEPVGSVNPVLAHKIFSHIHALRKNLGITFLIVEHRLDIAMQYVDEIYAMANGRIISKGSPQEVVEDPQVITSYLGN